MYTLKYHHNNFRTEKFKSFDLLVDELSENFSPKVIDKVAQAFEVSDTFHGAFFDVTHYVGYFYKGESYATTYALAEKLATEVDEETKVEWFIQNVGVCARKDDGDEIDLPWYDMFYDDYDHKAFDGNLVEEVDSAVAEEIDKALEEIAPSSGSFVLSFWESNFNIEVEEDDCLDMADDEEYDDEEEED